MSGSGVQQAPCVAASQRLLCATARGGPRLQRDDLLGAGHGLVAAAAVARQELALLAELVGVEQAHDAVQLRHVVLDRRPCMKQVCWVEALCVRSACGLHAFTSTATLLH